MCVCVWYDRSVVIVCNGDGVVVVVGGGGGGVPSHYFVSTQLQLWLFCCWGCGCCWVNIFVNPSNDIFPQ